MPPDETRRHLEQIGLATEAAYRAEAFARTVGLLTEPELERLRMSRVAIAGLGGVGGHHLVTLARTGVGCFHLADFDRFEAANVNRQCGARLPDFGRPKLDVMVQEALAINPFLELKTFPEGLTETNLDAFLEGVDLVLDGLDFFSFDIRRALFNRARAAGIHVITAGPLGFSTALLVFSPHQGMSFDDYFAITERLSEEEKLFHFAMGLAPRPTHIGTMNLERVSFSNKAGPSIASACELCAAVAATEAVRILLGRPGLRPVPRYLQFDPYRQKLRRGILPSGNRNPIQRLKMFVVKELLLPPEAFGHRPGPPRLPRLRIILRNLAARLRPAPLDAAATGAAGDLRPRPPLPRQVTLESGPDAGVPSGTAATALTDDALRYLVSCGIQAPSGDNAQPWKFGLDRDRGDRIFVYLDPDRDRSFFNVDQIASIISCGAVIENIRIGATSLGLNTALELLPDPEQPNLMAALRFEADAGVRLDSLAEFLWQRCTNRKMYAEAPLPPSVRRALQAALADFPQTRLHLMEDRRHLKRLSKLVYAVDRVRTEDRRLHDHLQRMIRFSAAAAQVSRDGLPLKNLEAGRAGELFLRLTRPWPVMRLMNRIGLGRLVALHAAQATRRSAAAALLTVSGTATGDYLAGGRAIQRLWLTATAQGLAFQPMAAATLFYTRWQRDAGASFLARHQARLAHLWGEEQTLFPAVDFDRDGQILLFRIGLGKGISCATQRRSAVPLP